MADGTLQPQGTLPFTSAEAEFLIGLSFRHTLREIISTVRFSAIAWLRGDLAGLEAIDAQARPLIDAGWPTRVSTPPRLGATTGISTFTPPARSPAGIAPRTISPGFAVAVPTDSV